MSTFQVIRVYFHKHEAQMAQGLLKNAGIQASVSTDDAAGSRPHLTLGMGEIRLLVHESDYGRAKESLKVMDEPLSEDEVRQLDDMALGAAESGDGKLSPPAYWYEETRCDVLIRIPEVRDLIARYAAMAKRPLPGEGFLAPDKFSVGRVSSNGGGGRAIHLCRVRDQCPERAFRNSAHPSGKGDRLRPLFFRPAWTIVDEGAAVFRRLPP